LKKVTKSLRRKIEDITHEIGFINYVRNEIKTPEKPNKTDAMLIFLASGMVLLLEDLKERLEKEESDQKLLDKAQNYLEKQDGAKTN